MDDKNWEQGPSTTNPVESLNRQSLQEGGTILHALMENIYLHAVKTQFAKRTWQRPTNHHLASRRPNESVQVKASVVTKVHRISVDIY